MEDEILEFNYRSPKKLIDWVEICNPCVTSNRTLKAKWTYETSQEIPLVLTATKDIGQLMDEFDW